MYYNMSPYIATTLRFDPRSRGVQCNSSRACIASVWKVLYRFFTIVVKSPLLRTWPTSDVVVTNISYTYYTIVGTAP